MDDTTITSTEQIDDLVRRTMREEEGRTHRESSTSTEPPADTPGPPKAQQLVIPDGQVALELLQRETGSREAALEILALDSQAVPAMKDAIEKRKAELQAAEQERVTQDWLASPAGRRHTADATMKAQQEKATLLAQARALLDADPQLEGIDLDSLSEDEMLQAAGVVDEPGQMPSPYALNEKEQAIVGLKSRWFQLASSQRIEAMNELGLTQAEQQQLLAEAKTATHPTAW